LTATGAQGTCTGTTANNDAVINLSAITNGTEANISTGATYTGSAYGDASNVDVSSGSGSLTGLMHNTQYTVRVFNGANDCFVDETITTPNSPCAVDCGNTTPGTDQPPCASTSGCLGGSTFEDFNCNGAAGANEPGVGAVIVNIYDCSNNLVGTTSSDAEGDWQVCGLTDTEQYRIEFVLPPAIDCWANPTHVGSDNGSDVQFVTAPACANFSLSNSDDYCQENPNLLTACFVRGNPLAGGTSGTSDVLVSTPYGTGGNSSNTYVADAIDMGSVWELAYHRNSGNMFASAFLKRHSGFGSQGIGGIYITDVSNTATTPYLDLVALGVNVGSLGARDLATNTNEASDYDAEAFGKVGKVGLGDIDISSDNSILYTINLFDKHLYQIDIGSSLKAGNTITAADITDIEIPNPNCSNGEWRPFALKFHNNKFM